MDCNSNSYLYESDAETLFSVGRRFLNGDCVEKDVAKAKEILTKAAELGHPMASKLLERIKELENENAELRKRLGELVEPVTSASNAMQNLSLQEKIDVFCSLFK